MAPPSSLPVRKLGRTDVEIPVLGLGLMGLSMGYGSVGTDEERFAVLDRAWELGCTHWDSSDYYGDSEELIGKWFKLHPERRQDIFLATKFGVVTTPVPGSKLPKFAIDNSAEYVRKACKCSLDRLGTDYIDLYYIHRLDNKKTPIEVPMKALAELKEEGKIKHIGLSECSSNAVRRACKIAPVDAVQVEYNPWELDIEKDSGTHLKDTCRELGVTIVCYSPLGRGFLTGQLRSPDDFPPGDMRNILPRFSRENFHKNVEVVDALSAIAARKGCTPGQLCLAWLIAQGDNMVPIPGTKKIKYLEENVAATKLVLSEAEDRDIRAVVDKADIAGHRTIKGLMTEYEDTPEL